MPSWLKGDVLDVKKMVTSWSIMQNHRGRKMKAMLVRRVVEYRFLNSLHHFTDPKLSKSAIFEYKLPASSSRASCIPRAETLWHRRSSIQVFHVAPLTHGLQFVLSGRSEYFKNNFRMCASKYPLTTKHSYRSQSSLELDG